ncbi:hypothetical protein PDE01_21510 [Paracoccus denitrificans]|nr:hypothetical protein PDE01_21510 [Paracoccus denitrificans]
MEAGPIDVNSPRERGASQDGDRLAAGPSEGLASASLILRRLGNADRAVGDTPHPVMPLYPPRTVPAGVRPPAPQPIFRARTGTSGTFGVATRRGFHSSGAQSGDKAEKEALLASV